MNTYWGVTVAVLVFWHIGFIFAAKYRRNDLADVLWGLGFVVATIAAITFRSRRAPLVLGLTELIIIFCVLTWASRLVYHIGSRFFKSDHEDVRYSNWRKRWGRTWLWRSYLQVFLLQSLILIVVSLPVLRVIDLSPRDISPLVIIGALLWLAGFFFEAVGDAQLRKFKADRAHQGQLMDRGLWSWSRHPNYFGEVVQWWGIFLMSVEPRGWWIIVSPVLITFFILKVSGVPMLEELLASRPGFAAYRERTSVFFPWPPKRK